MHAKFKTFKIQQWNDSKKQKLLFFLWISLTINFTKTIKKKYAKERNNKNKFKFPDIKIMITL
jgi:hypothetical protein